MSNQHTLSAYGGDGWSPRRTSLRDEIGSIWHSCGIDSEWAPLKAVLLHRPGGELDNLSSPDAVFMLESLDANAVRRQHDGITQALREHGITVHYVNPADTPPPNQLFVADLMFMTPEGAILGRPASTVRAGEERFVARRLADLGIPILQTVRGNGTFEGADVAWLDERTVLLATGLRTNQEGARQVTGVLAALGVDVIQVGLPFGSMHLMGELRFADRDLAIARPGWTPFAAVLALREYGYKVLFTPDEEEVSRRMALNFVTLGPRKILMSAGNPITQAFYEAAGITCVVVGTDEIGKAAGGIGCMTGIVERELVGTGA
jgi:N-dimethylarginine dimethylaminohydrolase